MSVPAHNPNQRFSNKASLGATAVALAILATAGAHAAPTSWFLQGFYTNTGAQVSGTFTYDRSTNTYSDIDIATSGASGTYRYQVLNSQAGSSQHALRVLETAPADLSGQQFLDIDFATPLDDAGGTIGVKPYPDGGSFQGRCRNSDCSILEGPYDRIIGGDVSTARIWYIEGAVTETGKRIRGNYAYDALNNHFPYQFIIVSGDGPAIEHTTTVPAQINESYLFSSVEAFSADMTGQSALIIALSGGMSSAGGTLDILPSPSLLSVCGNAQCGGFAGFAAIVSGRVTTSFEPPQIVSQSSVSVRENQTIAIDVQAQDDNDSEGAGLSFSKIGGPDEALFAVDSESGLVTFITPPAFLAPTDANVDNVYEISIAVTDLGNNEATVDLSIEVVGTPDITTGAALGFGEVAPFGMPIERPFEISNVGNTDLLVADISVTGLDEFAFQLVLPDACVGALAPLQTCTALVRYMPSVGVPAGPLEAALTIVSDDPDQPSVAIPISANIVYGSAQMLAQLSLGSVPLGATVTQSFPVVVSGPVIISLIVVDDPDGRFSSSSDCPLDTPTTSSCTVTVSYQPQVLGTVTVPLLLESTDPNSPSADIHVIATGVNPTDSDGDGVQDFYDNCTFVSNSDQRDSNGDGFGNLCDPDLDGNGVVNVVDLGMLRSAFFGSDADADFNGDGVVNVVDLGVLRSYFFRVPGPAGIVDLP